jgi:hypothetical protein
MMYIVVALVFFILGGFITLYVISLALGFIVKSSVADSRDFVNFIDHYYSNVRNRFLKLYSKHFPKRDKIDSDIPVSLVKSFKGFF